MSATRVLGPLRIRLLTTLALSSFLSLPPSAVKSQELVINELMSSNGETLLDEDGQSPDWIEITNTGEASLNLEGHGISDNASPFQWVFPSIIIFPQSHAVVFASGKDRRDAAAHWETVIDWGDEWKYMIPTSEPDSSWRMPGFDDATWKTGRTGIGYGDGDDRTEVPAGTISVYARKTFQVDDPQKITHVFLDIDFDDAFVAFLNGEEIARENIENLGRPPTYSEVATRYTEPKLVSGGELFHYPVVNFGALLRSGENVLSIQLHNTGPGSSDLTLIPFLTLGMDEVPPIARGPADLPRSNLPTLHTNFKIDAGGETITLTSPDGVLLDTVETGALPTDISVGRFPDGSGELRYHDEPTPGKPNSSPGYKAICGEPLFSHPAGFYRGRITLALATQDPDGTLHVTLDGAEPTHDSPLYESPIAIDSTTVVRAKVLAEGSMPGKTTTRTFFIDESFRLPVVSISTAPANFFDDETGIYVLGDEHEPGFPYFGANFWEDWERPVHLELFEADGTLGFSADAGAKIYGGWSRGHPQRSLAFFARNRYGPTEFRYRIFPKKKIKSYEAFVLRNSGNDWQVTHFRDAMMTSLLDDLEVDRQAYRPSVMFINGEYWGVMNLREKINEHFIESNHEGVKADQIDLLERDATVIHGDSEHYGSLIDLLANNPVSDPAIFGQVKEMMDVDNFIDYQAAEIYFDNRDWPGNNIKYWRPRIEGGRWRWIMFDTDFGFGIWNANNYVNNTLVFALEANGPNWPNPPWSTFMLRRLVTNEEFVENFVNRFATHLNTVFNANKVVDRIDEMEAAIESDMPAHRSLWGGSVSTWRSNVQVMRNFAHRRISHVRDHLAAVFNLGGLTVLGLEVSPAGSGVVEIQGIEISGYPWMGTYFQGIPIRITARPHPGFLFTGWTGISPPDQAAASVVLSNTRLDVTASFAIDCDAISQVVINEINYNAADDADPGDWVELHNPTFTTVDLSGWTFRDESDEHIFTLPAGTRLARGGYLVLCSDTGAFTSLFPAVDNVLGDLGYSFEGNGELLRLLDASGNEVDSLSYGDESPWPEDADGNGSTLALKSPILDNTHPPFWAASPAGGTPGSRNDVFEEVEADCESTRIPFLRGDSNADGKVEISDPISLLRFLFLDQGQISCLDASDANDDGSADISDALTVLFNLFNGTVDIPAPGRDTCGGDPTKDDLDCRSYPPCE